MSIAGDSGLLRVLIADDSNTDRLILQTIVKRLGHEVLVARDGVEALEIYRAHLPDVVLLDVVMPRLDGTEVAREVKRLAGENFVPVIFLTSLSSAEDLAECLDAGGDDFIPKPYNRVIIEAKINAFNRMRRMQQTMIFQRDLIHDHHERLMAEQQTARRVFDNIAHAGTLNSRDIKYHISPLSVFNGDVLYVCARPAGGKHIFVGDFTGHGLPAAIGALPLAEVFYSMTSKAFEPEDILREANRKLHEILPKGMFCCAALIKVDGNGTELKIWNGGLPDLHLVRNGERLSLPSRHLPLGISSPSRFNGRTEEVLTRPGDVLLVATDGLVEAVGPDGSMFGESRLTEVLDQVRSGGAVFESTLKALHEFTGSKRFRDDLTMLALDIDQCAASEPERPAIPPVVDGPRDWNCTYVLRNDSLRSFNPLPLLLRICLKVPELRDRHGEIYTLLAELYNNALEHGILGLSSAYKTSSEGFARYYRERSERLAKVSEGWIKFSLRHEPDPGFAPETGPGSRQEQAAETSVSTHRGGTLFIECTDSGEGFVPESSGVAYAGRGLRLLDDLCESFVIHPPGNRFEVRYRWHLGHDGRAELGPDPQLG